MPVICNICYNHEVDIANICNSCNNSICKHCYSKIWLCRCGCSLQLLTCKNDSSKEFKCPFCRSIEFHGPDNLCLQCCVNYTINVMEDKEEQTRRELYNMQNHLIQEKNEILHAVIKANPCKLKTELLKLMKVDEVKMI